MGRFFHFLVSLFLLKMEFLSMGTFLQNYHSVPFRRNKTLTSISVRSVSWDPSLVFFSEPLLGFVVALLPATSLDAAEQRRPSLSG